MSEHNDKRILEKWEVRKNECRNIAVRNNYLSHLWDKKRNIEVSQQ
jgi:hypothetical protein